MLNPSHPLRFMISYHTRRTVRAVKNVMSMHFAEALEVSSLPVLLLGQSTPVVRNLKGVDPQLFEGKRVNLEIALRLVSGITIRPNETFSFWHLIGNPTARRGFRPGLIIQQGRAAEGIGGGLCQLSNMMHWMALHSDLAVTERHRHSFDIFPDESRNTPFATGATVVYNYRDLRLHNQTKNTYQFLFELTKDALMGQIRCAKPPENKYAVVEKESAFVQTPDGLYRKNSIWKQTLDSNMNAVAEAHLFSNCCQCSYDFKAMA